MENSPFLFCRETTESIMDPQVWSNVSLTCTNNENSYARRKEILQIV